MLALLALIPAAFPCAGFVTTDAEGQIASSDAQQAILQVGDAQVSVEYRVQYHGNASDFAWVIPVPGKVDAVEEGRDDRFTALQTLTAPRVYHEVTTTTSPGLGCGCLGASKGGDLAGGRGADTGDLSNAVDEVASGYAGSFAYTVLEATDADGLIAYLQERGYDTTVSAPSIAAYVDDAIPYSFVTVRLVPDASTTPEGGVSLTPLRITHSAGADGALHVSYPARMAMTSMLPEVRTELYVLGAGRASLGAGWTEALRVYDDGYNIMGSGTDANIVYAEHLRALGGSNAVMLPVYGGMVEDALAGSTYVTRFDAIVAPSANIADATFTVGTEQTAFESSVTLPAEGVDTAAILTLPLGVGGWTLRRRRARAAAGRA